MEIRIDGDTLTLEALERVAREPGTRVGIAEGAPERMRRSRAVVERALASGKVVYGVTTGFGRLADIAIPQNKLEELQLNVLRSHACGVGTPLSQVEVRAITFLRANVLAKGFSGVRPQVVELLVELLNRGVCPVIPEQGPVGASGDLAPLSHLALVLVGEGEAEFEGERLPGGEGPGSTSGLKEFCRARMKRLRQWRRSTSEEASRDGCSSPAGSAGWVGHSLSPHQ